jgi:HPt (histidine-containing phosphotransfer) domain-containing protein
MTAHALRGDRERCLAAGMDDYVSKPMKAEDLLAAIGRAIGETPEPPPPAAPPPVDLPAALRTADGDQVLLRELVHLLAADCPRRLAEMREALEAGDGARIQQIAHGLKGALGSVGAADAVDLARALESIGRDGQLARAGALLGDLETEIDRVLAFFAEPEPDSRARESAPPGAAGPPA